MEDYVSVTNNVAKYHNSKLRGTGKGGRGTNVMKKEAGEPRKKPEGRLDSDEETQSRC